MAECNYSFPLDGSAQTGFAAAKSAIIQKGGSVAGDYRKGSAKLPSPVGAISIDYFTQGSTLHVAVTDKPWVASCQKIHAGLSEALASAPAPTTGSSSSYANAVVQSQVQPQVQSSSTSKVMMFDTQYIEGTVPKTDWYTLAMWGLAGFTLIAGGIWWIRRP